MGLADAHCHVGMYPDTAEVIARARQSGVEVVVATSRASEWRGLRPVEADGVRVGLGLHPELAGSVHAPHELAIFRRFAGEASWISEVGLDAPIADGVSSCFGATPTMAAQREMFEAVLAAAGPNRVYSVHSRGAEGETLAMLLDHGCRAVALHNFAGSAAEVATAVEAGYYFSIHPSSLDAAPGRETLRRIPVERLLVETDGPYFTWRGACLEPAHCPQIVDALAEVVDWSPTDLRQTVSGNFKALVDAAEQPRS